MRVKAKMKKNIYGHFFLGSKLGVLVLKKYYLVFEYHNIFYNPETATIEEKKPPVDDLPCKLNQCC